jgi:hypothetical protein
MTKTLAVFLLLTGLVLIAARPSSAQGQTPAPSKWMLNINLGVQPKQHDYVLKNDLTLYDEPASYEALQHVSRGLLFDVGFGRRRPMWRKLMPFVDVSMLHNSHNATVTAAIPDPLVFNNLATSTVTTSKLGHTEVGIHFSGVWPLQVTDRIDVGLSAGPSLLIGRQQVVPGVSPVQGTQDFTADIVSQTGVHLGFNAGADASYRINPKYGVGVFVRYAGGHVNLDSLTNMKVGGFQTGAGIRIRF